MRTRSEQFKSLALAALLSIGAGVIWGVLCGWGLGVLSDIVSPSGAYEQLVFRWDGTPIIESYVGRDYATRTFRTLDGKRVDLGDDGNAPSAQLPPAQLFGPEYRSKRFSGLGWGERLSAVHSSSYWTDPDAWYFIHDGKSHGHGYLVGYDKLARAKIGYIGSAGFRRDEPPPGEQFPVDGRRMARENRYGGTAMINSYDGAAGEVTYLLADDGLIKINLKKRSIAVVRQGADLVSGAYSMRLRSATEGPSSDWRRTLAILLLRTSDRVIVLTTDGKQIETYPLPAELRRLNLQWVALPGGKAIALENDHDRDLLFWLDTGGKIVRREQVQLRGRAARSKFMQAMIGSLTVPSPTVLVGFPVCYPWGLAEQPESMAYWPALGMALGKAWSALLATGIISAMLAVFCYRRQRKHGLPWTWVWTAFVLLFGLPAFFGYLAHRAWPVRLPCPNCGRLVPRDRPACFACGHDFPPPAMKGIEVFA